MWPRRLAEKLHSILRRNSRENSDNDGEQGEFLPEVQVVSSVGTSTRVSTRNQDSEDNLDHPLLYHLARTWSWVPLNFRCQTHPHEVSISYVDPHSGDHVLHWTVFGKPPLEVVQNLLHACPELAKTPNYAGSLPLHVAYSYRASAEVIAAILQVYPDAAGISNHQHRYPLHLLCDYGHPQVRAFREILQLPAGFPTIQTRDPLYRQTPLMAWNARENLAQRLRRKERMKLLVQKTPWESWKDEKSRPQEANNSEIQLYSQSSFWQTSALLIVAGNESIPIVANEIQDLPPTRILRGALVNQACPPSLQEYAVLIYHKHLLDRDQADQQVALHWAARYSSYDILLQVVQLCPQASHVRDVQNNFALHYAIANPQLSWHEGLQALVEANPEAVLELPHMKNHISAVLHILLARLGKSSILFSILRSFPTLMNESHIEPAPTSC